MGSLAVEGFVGGSGRTPFWATKGNQKPKQSTLGECSESIAARRLEAPNFDSSA